MWMEEREENQHTSSIVLQARCFDDDSCHSSLHHCYEWFAMHGSHVCSLYPALPEYPLSW